MTAAQQRKLQRTVHLATGLMLVATIYGPNLGHFHDFVRLVALPLLVLTGIAMWQAPRIRRLRKRIAGVLATTRRRGQTARLSGTPPEGDHPMKLTTLTHVGTRTDSAGASLLSFRPRRPFSYRAGQFGLWIVGASARPFTITSAPSDELIQLGTRLHSESRIKRALSSLRPGDTVRLLGPFGNIAPTDDGRPVVYIAQGIGITPARALIRERPRRHQTLIHIGAPYFREELDPLVDTALYPASREDFTVALTTVVPVAEHAHYVVAGSTNFVTETNQALRHLGCAPDRIHADGFIGLTDILGDSAAAPQNGELPRVSPAVE